MAIGQHLDFDMPWFLDEFFDENPVIAEGGFRFIRGKLKAFARLGLVCGDAHALAAAAGRCFDHHRIADFSGGPRRFSGIGDNADMAGHSVHSSFFGEYLRLNLVAHHRDGADRRADEDDAGVIGTPTAPPR